MFGSGSWDYDTAEDEPGNAGTEGPEPLDDAAYHEIIGEFVKLVEPHSESDPAALAGSLAAGNYLSRNMYYLADGSKHYPNQFPVIVGDSSKGRKGHRGIRLSVFLSKRIGTGCAPGEIRIERVCFDCRCSAALRRSRSTGVMR
jgi:hypothetical protein